MLVVMYGLKSIYNYDLVKLYKQGHNVTNVQNALGYFEFSPKAEKYRNIPSVQR